MKMFKLLKAAGVWFLIIAVITAMLAGCCCPSGDSSDTGNDDYAYDDNNSNSSISESEAISIAKKSTKVQNEIANKHRLKFFSTPDWGTCTAEKNAHGDWHVELNGNISGYTDNYKTDFVYGKMFTAIVTVSSSGSVKSVIVN